MLICVIFDIININWERGVRVKESLRKLIKIWDLDEENYNKGIYISKKDLEYLTNNVEKFEIKNSYYSYGKDKKVYFNLVPKPWWGNIENPEVIILLLNPGFTKDDDEDKKILSDHNFEENNAHLKEEMINNLKQSNNNINWFDDKWKNAGSYHWWKPRLKEIAGELKADDPYNYIYNNIGFFEFFGYHSKSFDLSFLKNDEFLPTQKAMFEYLNKLIKVNNPLVVIVWGQKKWQQGLDGLAHYDEFKDIEQFVPLDYIDTISTASSYLSKDNLRPYDFKRIVDTLNKI